MEYYIEDIRSGPVGNCLYFWRKEGAGYTCNLDDAEVFDEKEATELNESYKYRAWPVDYLRERTVTHVDHQKTNRDFSMLSEKQRIEAEGS